MSSVFEIVTYTVKNIADAEQGRIKARRAVSSYPGFIRWTCFTAVEGQRRFVDLVEWENLTAARSAQEKFLQDPEMHDFLVAFSATLTMTHAHAVNRD
jgi:hypothetical protein